MKPILAIFFAFASFTATPAASAKTLIVLGDSLTEGYGVAREKAFPAVLEKKIQDGGKKDWKVVNAGISGSTTASAVGRMKWLFKNKPDMVVLCLGANDGLRGLKVEDSQKNLSEAIEFARKAGVRVVLGGLYMPPNYGKDYTDKFRKMYLDLKDKYKTPFIPFLLEKVGGVPEYNLADGIHPNEKGHAQIADNVYATIKDLL